MEQGGGVSAPSPTSAPSAGTSEPQAATETGAAPDSTQANSAPAQNDDPEIELDDGLKLKKSELRDIAKKRKEYDRAASMKFDEAAKLKREVEAEKAQVKAIVEGLSKDAKAAMRKAGLDPVKVAEQILAEALEDGNLTDEQRELRALKAEKAQREAEEAERKKQDEEKQSSAAVDQLTDDISHDFLTILKPKNLPVEDLGEIMSRMAFRVEALLDAGAPIDLEAIAEESIDRHFAGPKQIFAGLSDEQILERYPEEVERVRKALLAKAQKQPTQPSKPMHSQPRERRKSGLSLAELREVVDKRVGA